MLLLAALCGGLLAACESTQDKSRRLAAHGGSLAAEKGVSVARTSSDVKVLSTSVIEDVNGSAAVVKVRNVSKRNLWQLPITIDVRGPGGKSVFRNDQPGLEPTLAHVPLVLAGKTVTWVDDQVTPTGKPKAVRAIVGQGATLAAGSIPQIALSGVRLQDDPVSGVAAVGVAANRSKVEQRKLVIFAVARRGARVVAAGRAQIPKLKPGKRAKFQAFFIGNPRGARLELSAPPAVVR